MILGNKEDEISLPFPGAEGFVAGGGDGAGTTGTSGRVDSDTAGTGAASVPDSKHDSNSTSLLGSFCLVWRLLEMAAHQRTTATLPGSFGGMIQVSENGLFDC